MTADHLEVIGRACFDEEAWEKAFVGSASVLPASSSLLIELTLTGLVSGKFNDEPMLLKGCNDINNCGITDFVAALDA